MTTITITLTEKELHAFEEAKAMMDGGYLDNLSIDEEMGDDNYKRVHEGLDSIQVKIAKKFFEEEEVARLVAENPGYPKAAIRKHVQKHIRENWKA